MAIRVFVTLATAAIWIPLARAIDDQEQNERKIVEHIWERWRHEKEDHVSSILRVKVYRYRDQAWSLRRDDFIERLRASRPAELETVFAELGTTLPPVPPKSQRAWGWEYQTHQQGVKVRGELALPNATDPNQTGRSIELYDGSTFTRYHSGNRQVTVGGNRAGADIMTLWRARFLPQQITAAPSSSWWKLARRGPGSQVLVELGPIAVECDKDTGFVYSCVYPGPTQLTATKEYIQIDPMLVSNDFYVPRLRVDLHHKDGRIIGLNASLVEEVRLNVDISDDVFARLDVPPGTKLVDLRAGGLPKRVFYTREQARTIEEVVDRADRPPQVQRGEPARALSLWRVLIGVASLIGGLGLTFVIIRRRSRRTARPNTRD